MYPRRAFVANQSEAEAHYCRVQPPSGAISRLAAAQPLVLMQVSGVGGSWDLMQHLEVEIKRNL